MKRFDEPDLLQQARKLMQEGRFELAAPLWEQLAERDQGKIELRLKAAQCYEKSGNARFAARFYLDVANDYASGGFYLEALAALRIYKRLRPDDLDGVRGVLRQLQALGVDPWHIEGIGSERDKAIQQMRFRDFFSGMDQTHWLQLVDQLEYVEIADGEMLMRQGDVADSLYFVLDGELRAYRHDGDRRIYLGHARQGDVAGEVAYFNGGQRTADMVAAGASRLLRLSYDNLHQLAQSMPELESHIEALYRQHILIRQIAMVPLFTGLSFEDCSWLAAHLEPLELEAGVALFSQGERNSDLFYLRSGYVVLVRNVHGNEYPYRMKSNGALLGALAVVNHGERSSTARTVTACRLLRLPGDLYARFSQQHPEIGNRLRVAYERQQQFAQRNELKLPETDLDLAS